MSILQISRYQLATFIAILFHLIGLTGILFFDQAFFTSLTPLNLLLMFGLICYTQAGPYKHFIIFMLLTIGIGIFAEIVGVSTGLLFGNYEYGSNLGPAIHKVPLIIGINWFIIIYCCGISVHMMLTNIVDKLATKVGDAAPSLKAISIVFDGATMAVFFDWVMEPAAVKLAYWHWLGDGEIPLLNYGSWFVISALLLLIFHFAQFNKQNKFAVNLLLIQAMFFLLLRTFL